MRKKKKSIFKKIKIILGLIFLAIICYGIIVFKIGYDSYKSVIAETPLSEKVENIRSKKNYIKIEDIPEFYKKGVLSVEDIRFYDHHGIDIISLGRAIVDDVMTLSLSQGGSTISQQLAKNLYLSQGKKFSRKIAEIFIVKDLEEKLSKDEILELYLNIIYYGDGYYGIGNASLGYFDKLPKDLTKYEQSILVGLPNAPSVYQLSNNSELTYQRQNIVLNKMKQYGFITDEDIKEIKSQGEK